MRAGPTARLSVIVGLVTAAPAATASDLATVAPQQLSAQAAALGGATVDDPTFVGGPGLRIPATQEGVALRLPGGLPWTRARFLTADALVDGSHAGEILVRFFAARESAPRLRVSLWLFPGLRTRLSLPLAVLDGQTPDLPRTPGRLEGHVRGRRIDPGQIERVEIQLLQTTGPQNLYLGPIGLGSVEPRFPLPAKPLVDELGQWVAEEWEGKTDGDPFLGTFLTFALDEHEGVSYPKAWCPRGGTTTRTFEATGFFRTEHDKERWWLVDPEGHGFFSVGLGAVRPGEHAVRVPGTEALFGRLPSKRGPLGEAWDSWGSPPLDAFSFGLANLIRSFGPQWRRDWTVMTRRRLAAWRFNTVGSGSDPAFAGEAGLPYVVAMPPYPTTRTRLFRDFPDVFAEEFRTASRRYALHLAPFRDDANLVGYFMHDEPRWALESHNIAAEMLETNPGTETRRALAAWLRRRYRDDAADWSVAWGLGLRTFDDVVEKTLSGAAARSETARLDLWEFSKEMVRAWVGIPGIDCNEVDPHHLNLGMRYPGLTSELLYEAVGVFDVFSITAYDMEPPAEVVEEIAARTNRPVLIGAFHFGALDRGLPAAGRPEVVSQRERGIAYRRYVERAAVAPGLVGVHYALLNDQPVLGRFDGESQQIGFVDVCHRPYRGLVDSASRANESVYLVREGAKEPFAGRAREIPQAGGEAPPTP